jgi:3-dehydroquinate dehydratase-1
MSARTLLGDGRLPLICVPLVARTHSSLMADARIVIDQSPDVIEWRVDHFDDIESYDAVLAAGHALREVAGKTPLICTLRSSAEGGRPLSLAPSALEALRLMMADQLPFEFHDVEMRLSDALVSALVRKVHDKGRKVILSAHDFNSTPSDDELRKYFLRANQLGGDVAKVAVMPTTPDDVLRLLSVTRRMCESLPIPIISMSMGSLGVMSRIFGGVFGSALTFATGAGESAPGQIPLRELREMLNRVS